MLDDDNIKQVLKSFLGKQTQIPPMYSAIKVNGKKLYEYARSGKTVEVKARDIEIFDISLISVSKDIKEIIFKVWCSKGTYIRSLCEDIAEKLGTVGFMSGLNRIRVGDFRIEQAVRISDVVNGGTLKGNAVINSSFISMENFLENKRKIVLDDIRLGQFLNGVKIGIKENDDGVYRVYSRKMKFIGSGIVENGRLKRDIIVI